MRIMLIISSLRRGGAERIVSILADYWVSMGHQVFLVTIEGVRADAYSLRPEIVRIGLNLTRVAGNPVRGFWVNLRRIRKLWMAARDLCPDVAVSFVTHTNLLTLLALWRSNVPVIISERTDPSQWWLGRIREGMRRRLYPRAAAVVVQTRRVQDYLQHRLPRSTFIVIPNPVPAADPDGQEPSISLREWLRLPATSKVVAAMGRLEPQKGFDLLVEAFGRLHGRHPEWHLVIFGDGVSRHALEAQVAESELAGRVHLPGSVRAPRAYLADSDLFVLSSRVEGFPNVLLEAMACGKAVISFDCPSGPGEIIRNDYDGLLVEAGNVTALEAAMCTLMSSRTRREVLGSNARQVLERFATTRIMTQWDRLLASAVSSKGS